MRAEEYKISKEKFTLVNENKKLRDKELVTKPVGFFMDAMHRFSRNKGSIFGAIIIGLLVLYALIVPILTPYTVSYKDTYYRYTLPKLFNSEYVDFLDGCKNQTLNETTFLYYYSMGEETGHNAVKRQQYSRYHVEYSDSYMYNIRLDTYQSPGCVFKSFTMDEYLQLQEYQDEHNVQIIYPITDPALRPTAPQSASDANYWYKTKQQGSITVADEYTIKEDGTVDFTNIYLAYSAPILDSVVDEKSAGNIVLVEKDAGYALSVNVLKKDGSDFFVGYLALAYDSNHQKEVGSFVEELDDASVFTFDAEGIAYTEINGHDDPTKDGNYFLGVGLTMGSSALILHESEIANYIPMKLYLNNQIVDNPQTGIDYRLYADRTSTQTARIYIKNFLDGSFQMQNTRNGSIVITIEETTDGYYFKVPGAKKPVYLCVNLNENNEFVFSSVAAADENTTVWHYDASNHGMYITIDDVDYYFASQADFEKPENNKILMAAKDTIDTNNIYVLKMYVDGTYEEPAALVNNGTYKIYRLVENVLHRIYYLNGGYKGDNYTSKMRVEGENNNLYSYAVQKSGAFETRINYYEYYKYYHSYVLKDGISDPFFIFGTTNSGQDIFVCLASGARFSFVMAIIVAVVNMIVGAIYGAIEGYYGGKIDLIMERIVEILSAVPFMIVITLLKYHMGGTSQVVILFIAFFLTGWIGESGLVRMQFYRFKNQEYVLAARTLGASDPRIMFKHIFPNSLGTIVTSSVLVIPNMIFSETSLSYLGIINLNSGNMTSVGTLLANAQPYLVTYPHMILFPAIFISLLMLCFNLFGNGLRDAFNPSLRGTED